MRAPSPLRAGLCISAAALAASAGYLSWQAWKGGASEGTSAWEQGRVVALSIANGKAETGLPTPEAKAESTAPASPTPTSPEPAAPESVAPPVAEPPPTSPTAPTAEPPAAAAPTTSSLPPVTTASAHGALASAPAPQLSEQETEGVLPVIGKDGTKPWQHYGRPFVRTGNAPIIAIVVTGLGQNKNASELAAGLPPDISLSFSPYARDAQIWINAARAQGHEALLDLPAEPENFPATDPGPLALLSVNAAEENIHRLRQLMASGIGTVGFSLPASEIFTAQKEQLKLLNEQLAPRGLLLFAGGRQKAPEGSGMPFLQADYIIDNEPTAPAVTKQLAALEALALSRGYAIGISGNYPVSLKEIARWAEGLSQRGFQLAPLSALAKMRFS